MTRTIYNRAQCEVYWVMCSVAGLLASVPVFLVYRLIWFALLPSWR